MQLRRGLYQQAEMNLAMAAALEPSDSRWQRLRGTALQQLQRHSEGLDAHFDAVALNPDDAWAHLSLGLSLLLHGRYEEGLPHYEWRLRSVVEMDLPQGLPRWDGRSFVPQLLVVAEQGIGDLVMMLRYLPMLTLVTQSLGIVASPPLHGLLHTSGLFDQVAGFGEVLDLQPGAAWIPLMSLLAILGVRQSAVLVDGPYLMPEPRHVAHWCERLRPKQGLLVGLGWQGNPAAETGAQAGRSLRLESLAPLAEFPGVQFLSLQKGPGAEQQANCSFRHRFSPAQAQVDAVWDLMETLAFLALCDLVITTDTALAHLAAASGRPTWILLKAVPDWRWGLEGDFTPWYPSARLFRQRRTGDWPEVVQRLVVMLADHERLQRSGLCQ